MRKRQARGKRALEFENAGTTIQHMTSYEAHRRFYARFVAAQGEVVDARIIEAFATTRREKFAGPAPWHIRVSNGYLITETDDSSILYQDILIGLAPDRWINNGQPSLHARCLGAAAPKAGDTVVHVGAGTGYYTAILASLVGQDGKVHAYEIESDLISRATANLADIPTVTVHPQSALEAQLPSADVIYVCAGATHVPAVWLDALAPGGRLVLPLTPNERMGCMLLVTRLAEAVYAARIFSTAAFIHCIGARDDEQSRALAAALDTRSTKEVRSLQRGVEPDDTAWCIGSGWWLSTAKPN
jgi:protein-L-isoaspartate(D-aspartate) O-methyltransferase